jgi:hypothetical protein
MRHVVYIIVLSVSLSIQLVFQLIYGRPFVSFEVYIAGLQCNPFHMLVFSRNFLCHLIDIRVYIKIKLVAYFMQKHGQGGRRFLCESTSW